MCFRSKCCPRLAAWWRIVWTHLVPRTQVCGEFRLSYLEIWRVTEVGMSRGSSAIVVTKLWAIPPRNHGLISGRYKRFLYLKSFQTCSCTRPTSCAVGTGGFFFSLREGIMRTGHDHIPPRSVHINTLWTGHADLRLYITTVQDGWRKSAFLTRAWFPRTTHLITQYMEHISEWSCWRMFIRGLEL